MEHLTGFLLARITEQEASAGTAGRVAAECEMKRLIIQLCEDAITAGELRPGTTWNDDAAGAMVGGEVLRLLAWPDAAHPDYREEWEPRVFGDGGE